MNLIHTGDGNFWAGYLPSTYSSVSNLVRLFYVIHPSGVSEFFVSLILSEYAVETSKISNDCIKYSHIRQDRFNSIINGRYSPNFIGWHQGVQEWNWDVHKMLSIHFRHTRQSLEAGFLTNK